jgi:hypothetical protein
MSDQRLKVASTLTVEPTEGVRVRATLIQPSVFRTPGQPFTDAPYPGKTTERPVIVSGTFGKGRFIYFGFEFYSEYVNQGLPVYSEVLRTLLDGTYQPSVVVTAPTAVEAVYSQLGSELRIALINGITARPAGGGMWAEPTQRGYINIIETIPIHNVQIRCRGRVARRATNLDNRQLPIRHEAGEEVIAIPPLEQYDVITIEFA